MKALILIGSGHSDSRCYELGLYTKERLEENKINTKLIQIHEKDIHECLGCEYCLPHQNECIIHDEMEDIYKLIDDCDYLIFISPVYFSNIPAELKKVIDRCQLYFNLKDRSHIKQKKFLAIHVGGAPSYPKQFVGFENTYEVLLGNFNAELSGFVKISHSDRVNPLQEKNLEEISKQINNLIK